MGVILRVIVKINYLQNPTHLHNNTQSDYTGLTYTTLLPSFLQLHNQLNIEYMSIPSTQRRVCFVLLIQRSMSGCSAKIRSVIFMRVQIQEVILTKEMLMQPFARARRSQKSFYLVQDRYNSSFFFSAYHSPQAFENGIEDCESRLGKKFQHRFRVPYVVFVEICQDIERVLGERAGVDRAGDKTIPIGLIVLASLRVLGSGCTFEAVEELMAVAECIHQKFFHEQFCM